MFICGFGLLVLAYPSTTLERRLLDRGYSDPVVGRYLRAWLDREPANDVMRLRLAEQMLGENRVAEARDELARLADSPDSHIRRETRWIVLTLAERETYKLAQDHPERAARMAELRDLVREALKERWDTVRLGMLGRMVQEVGLRDPVASAAPAESAQAASAPPLTRAEAAAIAIGEGRHADAAELLLGAMKEAPSAAERRALFLRALKTYQAASLFDAAFAAAERHGAAFLADLETVEYLVHLARAANRPALAEHYVRIMLRLGTGGARRGAAASAARWIELMLDGLVGVALAAEERALVITLPYDARLYVLAYDVFLGNGNLRGAQQVAATAIRHAPKNAAWRKRFAHALEWDGQAAPALEQWLAYARLSGDEDGWDQVLRIAPALFDHETLVIALEQRLERGRADPKAVEALVAAYERLGDTDRAIRFLRDVVSRQPTEAAMRMLAELAARTGDDRLALETYDALADRFGANAGLALKQAIHAYVAAGADQAWERLARARNLAKPEDEAFWRTFAQLSQLLGRIDDAIEGYRTLATRRDANEADLAGLIALLQGRYPAEAARIAELAFERFADDDWLVAALQLNADRRDWTAFRRLLARLSDTERERFERRADFLLLRATLRRETGDAVAAIRDLKAAEALAPQNATIREALLWALVTARAKPDLERHLVRWRQDALRTRALWAPFAAAHVLLDQPRSALAYYSRLLQETPEDYLLALAYAAALEQMLEVDRAWEVRRHVWTKLRHTERARIEEDPRARDLRNAIVQLAIRFEPGDRAAALLGELLRLDRPEAPSPAARELALSWALATGARDLAQAWYLRQYARDLGRSGERPYWALLALALDRDDQAMLGKLLDEQADLLPVHDRIEAARRVGRVQLAEQWAFERLERFDADDEAHRRVVEQNLAAAHRIDAELVRTRQGPLALDTHAVRASRNTGGGLHLGARVSHSDQQSLDGPRLTGVPGRDNAIELFGRHLGRSANTVFAVTRRHALASHTGLRLERTQRGDGWSVQASAGANQPSTESAYLRAGGMKDMLEAVAIYQLSRSEYASAGLRLDRFRSQAGGYLGRSTTGTLELGHRVRLEYPDLTVRAVLMRSVVTRDGAVDDALRGLLPPGVDPTVAAVLPGGYRLFGVFAGFGESHRREYTRAARPFADVGWLHSNAAGGGYAFRLGVAGSVLGSDHLAIYFAQSKGTRGSSDVFREIGVAYRW